MLAKDNKIRELKEKVKATKNEKEVLKGKAQDLEMQLQTLNNQNIELKTKLDNTINNLIMDQRLMANG